MMTERQAGTVNAGGAFRVPESGPEFRHGRIGA
jgi:hypothetical protein